jgi:hypothetical protein
MKRSAVGGLTRDTSVDVVLSIILRDGGCLSRGGFGREPLPSTSPQACELSVLRYSGLDRPSRPAPFGKCSH